VAVDVGGAAGIVGSRPRAIVDADHIRQRLKLDLPNLMARHETRALTESPLNANGEFDRNALAPRQARQPA
jgi:hypothetical protein